MIQRSWRFEKVVKFSSHIDAVGMSFGSPVLILPMWPDQQEPNMLAS